MRYSADNYVERGAYYKEHLKRIG